VKKITSRSFKMKKKKKKAFSKILNSLFIS